jgi:argininosuccinate lyase
MFRDANRAVRLVAAALGSAQFDCARMAERAEQGWITVTELADTITRDHGVPFKTGHTVATRFVAECSRHPGRSRAAVLREVSIAVLGRAVEYDDPALDGLLSARHFVAVRKTFGGPAPSETARAIARSREVLISDTGWREAAVERLRAAERNLKDAAKAL